MASSRQPTLTTIDSNGNQKTWTKTSSKKTGAHNIGYYSDEYLGFYRNADRQRAYVKQDKSANNIAEFLAGRIYKKLIPHASAKIHLAHIPTPSKVSQAEVRKLGSDVCVVSEFIPGASSDLYGDIQRADNKDPERSSVTAIEMLQIFTQMRNMEDAFNKNDYQDFAQVMVSSLLQNNIDTHVGNFMVILNPETEKKHLGVIDYGASWMKMTDKIRPHSFFNIFLGHLGEAWNNFLFYPEKLKITPHFVAELDRVAKVDLRPTIEDAFKEIAKFYDTQPILEFAMRAELIDKADVNLWLKQEKSKDDIVKEVVDRCVGIMQKRQLDLSRLSAQIKLDLLCERKDENKIGVTGSFTINGKKQTFYDVAFQHIDYFKEVLSGKEQLKLRKKDNKSSTALLQGVKEEMVFVVASLIVAKSPGTRKLDDIVKAIQDGKIKGDDILKLCGEGPTKPKMIAKAREVFRDLNSLVQLAKIDGLRKNNKVLINSILLAGSNPDLSMPGGRKLIDYAKDAETRLLLVKHGASLPKSVPNSEKAVLVKERQRYLRRVERQTELGKIGRVGMVELASHTDLATQLKTLKKDLLETKWNTAMGNEVVFTIRENGKQFKRTNIVPDGIKKILDIIHQAEKDSLEPINKDNPQIWIDALEEIKIIARNHGSYSSGKMFFFGQDENTKVKYNEIVQQVTDLLDQIKSQNPSSKPQ